MKIRTYLVTNTLMLAVIMVTNWISLIILIGAIQAQSDMIQMNQQHVIIDYLKSTGDKDMTNNERQTAINALKKQLDQLVVAEKLKQQAQDLVDQLCKE